jgi:hypothetical protein
MTLLVAEVVEDDAPEGEAIVRVDHVMESRDIMNIHVVEHSILNGIEYCTFWFRSVVEMTRHQLLLQVNARSDGERLHKQVLFDRRSVYTNNIH